MSGKWPTKQEASPSGGASEQPYRVLAKAIMKRGHLSSPDRASGILFRVTNARKEVHAGTRHVCHCVRHINSESPSRE